SLSHSLNRDLWRAGGKSSWGRGFRAYGRSAAMSFQEFPDDPGSPPSPEERAADLRPMTPYRCYLMDANGDFLDVANVECDTDDQAVRAALKAKKREKDCHGFQVWRGVRLVYQQGKANLVRN